MPLVRHGGLTVRYAAHFLRDAAPEPLLADFLWHMSHLHIPPRVCDLLSGNSVLARLEERDEAGNVVRHAVLAAGGADDLTARLTDAVREQFVAFARESRAPTVAVFAVQFYRACCANA